MAKINDVYGLFSTRLRVTNTKRFESVNCAKLVLLLIYSQTASVFRRNRKTFSRNENNVHRKQKQNQIQIVSRKKRLNLH